MDVKVFDNVSSILKQDLEVEVKKDSRLSVAATYFSIYAFEALKKQLEQIKDSKARLQSLKNNISPVIANEVRQSGENNAPDCRVANAPSNDDKNGKGQDNG